MPFLPIKIPPGVVRLATPLQSKGRYWDANLIRWRAGKLQPVGGWQKIVATALSSVCRTVFSWTTNIGLKYVAFGCQNHLQILESETLTNITPAGYVAPEILTNGGYGASTYGNYLYGSKTGRPLSEYFIPSFSWTIDNWGEDILAVSSSDGRLLYWTYTQPVATAVGVYTITTAIRASNVVTVTTTAPHFYFTGDEVQISGNSVASMNGNFIIDSIPTEKTFTFASVGTAGTGTGGSSRKTDIPRNNRAVIVTPERNAVCVGAGGNPRRVAWSDTEDFTNWDFADPTTTAGYLDLDSSSSITMCCSVREGTLIWTEDEVWLMRYIGLPYIYAIERIGFSCGLIAPRAFATAAGRCMWMGREGFWIYDGGVVRPLPCDVASYVFQNLDPDTSVLHTHGSDNSLFNEVWFWYPSTGSTVPNKYVIYNYAEQWWSIGSMTRTAATGGSVYRYPIATDSSNFVYFQEDGWTAAGTALTNQRFAETAVIDLQSGANTMMIRQAMADSGYSYNSTSFTFYASFTPDGTETTHGPYNPRADGYTDVRITGRDIRMKVVSTQDAEWSIGEVRLDLTPRGSR